VERVSSDLRKNVVGDLAAEWGEAKEKWGKGPPTHPPEPNQMQNEEEISGNRRNSRGFLRIIA
jgi:hypothetical protein